MKHLFSPEADFDLGAAYADTLYTVLSTCDAPEHVDLVEAEKNKEASWPTKTK